MSDRQPSTEWREEVAADESERFARYGEIFAAIQKRRNAKFGNGRALHRKQLLAARGEFEVFDGLPEFARQGLFAAPRRYEARVRLSNGGMDRAPDRVPDIRGFSFAVLGVDGDSALGRGPARSQGFALINQPKFAFPKSAEFIDFVAAAAESKGALVKHLVARHGLIGGPARLLRLARSVGRPFKGFANETFHSAAPIACGPYAVRVRLVPDPGNGAADPAARADWGADMARRLRGGALAWTLELQPFVDERSTPIEDASVDWPTAYTAVARLTLPPQDPASPAGQAIAAEAESGSLFDPWSALAAHRPLGDVMRARRAIYFTSQKGRGAA